MYDIISEIKALPSRAEQAKAYSIEADDDGQLSASQALAVAAGLVDTVDVYPDPLSQANILAKAIGLETYGPVYDQAQRALAKVIPLLDDPMQRFEYAEMAQGGTQLKELARSVIPHAESPLAFSVLKKIAKSRKAPRQTKHHCLTAMLDHIATLPVPERAEECAEILRVTDYDGKPWWTQATVPQDVAQPAARMLVGALKEMYWPKDRATYALLVLEQPDTQVNKFDRRDAALILAVTKEFLGNAEDRADKLLQRFADTQAKLAAPLRQALNLPPKSGVDSEARLGV